MPSNNICSSITNTNDENSNALISTVCKSTDCHCEGNGVVTNHTTSPNITQKCYITNSGCHEAIITTTTQEVKRHKCPPKIQKIHEHISQPTNYSCTSQLGSISGNIMMNPCVCNLPRSSCCRTHHCAHNNGNIQVTCCNKYASSGCGCSCCCCSTSTVQTTLYPVYMSFPYNQGRNINIPYTVYSNPFNTAYNPLTDNQYSYQY
ncbi:uncharacterized protein cubi_02973 [Cryptosporidium ubiquitum]|uniref:Uncharacterized protein n=1 Tax=Cryptosporidium ubiquitum TaxID=857276 RepID=A0A1J4MKT3_9CRYT|nr:uncharacterized protein cubi_02973 [Cryptosporidium ubiquitum]OII74841.1 hypothetical protein cubi_02973 [Cryptosporidium ubiquitum]